MTTHQHYPDPMEQARQWLAEHDIPFKQTSEYHSSRLAASIFIPARVRVFVTETRHDTQSRDWKV